VNEIQSFAELMLIAGAVFAAALLAIGFTRRVHLPTPAVFLAFGFLVGSLWSSLADVFGPVTTSRVGTAGLIVILFGGGLNLGLRGLRAQGRGVALLGIVGTALTAVALAGAAHVVTDLDWTESVILGAILAPTDPAAVFSLLRGRNVSARASSILEGEAGINDPVAIVLTIAMLESVQDGVTVTGILGEMAVEAAIGTLAALAVFGLVRLLIRGPGRIPHGALPLLLLAFGFVAYGVGGVAGGSGFLAVYLLGLLLGDDRVASVEEVRSDSETFSHLAEASLFLTLGVALNVVSLQTQLAAGLVLGAVLVAAVRPAVAGLLLAGEQLDRDERLVCILGGLKGAVPLVLATLPFIYGLAHAPQLFALAAIVSIGSMVVQGVAVSLLISVRSERTAGGPS
jgi:cell volume regulation protein A